MSSRFPKSVFGELDIFSTFPPWFNEMMADIQAQLGEGESFRLKMEPNKKKRVQVYKVEFFKGRKKISEQVKEIPWSSEEANQKCIDV